MMSNPKTSGLDVPVLADDRAARISAFIIRITAGLLFVENLTWKTPPHFGADDQSGLYYFTTLGVDYPVAAPVATLLENVVLPNFGLFGWSVFIVEICLAVFLVLGLATRFWAIVGIAQALAIFLTVGAAPHEWKWSYFLMMATMLAVFGFAAGRVVGLDAVLRPKASRSSLLGRAYRLGS
jgi:thiosulfate dehydrogenase (quinone) large subunit